jgi:protein-disulfide isomerase
LLAYAHAVIHATCLWCLASGIAMTLLFFIGVALTMVRTPLHPVRPIWIWTLAFLTATAIGVEAGFMQKRASTPPVPAERLAQVPVAELVDQANSLGPADAPVTIVMFADLWCPACRVAEASLVGYQRQHPEAVRLVFRHLPLWHLSGHQTSRAAAALSEMAGEHGKFWPFIQAMYAQHRPLDRDGYLQLMRSLGLDTAKIDQRLDDPDDPAIQRVQRDEALAKRLGIEATPVFIVLIRGHHSISANQRTLPRILNSAEVQSMLARANRKE